MRTTTPGVSRRQLMQAAGLAALGLVSGCSLSRPPTPQPAAVRRIGYLSPGSTTIYEEGLRQGLRERGYVEGRNIVIEYRYAEGSQALLETLAEELVHLNLDVLVATSDPAAVAARKVTVTMPIVMWGDDPLSSGLADSLARPGGNVTGMSLMNTTLSAKRLEYLKSAVPALTRVGVLRHTAIPHHAVLLTELDSAARILGVQVHSLAVDTPSELENAFDVASEQEANGLIILPGRVTIPNRARIADLAIVHRLPMIADRREFVDAGGLMSYGASSTGALRRVAYYVDRILKGTRPSDLPIEQPTVFELVINLKTARALGLTIPDHVLLQATEFIQ